MVDLRADRLVADVGVDVVGEIERRGAEGQPARLAFRCEDDDFGGVERQLEVIQKVDGVFRRRVERIADLFEPLVQLVLVLRNGLLLVLPVGGHSPFGDVVHALRADLHLDPYAVGAHHRRVQRLVTVGFRGVDPVAQAVGLGRVDVRDRGIDLVTLRLFRREGQRFEDDADGEQIVDLFERNLFALHLHPDRVDALDTGRNLEIDAVVPQRFDDRSVEACDELLARRLRLVQFAADLLVLLRKTVLHAEVFQFGFDGEKPQSVRQRREEVDRLAGDLDLLVQGHGAQRAHVVQPVGDLDEDYPHVVREREQHLAEIFGLLRRVGVEDARHLGQSVDHRGDLRAEDALHVFDRVFCVFHHVVQQRCDDRFDSQSDLLDDDFRHGDRVQQIGFSRTAAHTGVRLFRKEKGAPDEVPILIFPANFGTGTEQVFPSLLDDFFVFGRVIHIPRFRSALRIVRSAAGRQPEMLRTGGWATSAAALSSPRALSSRFRRRAPYRS